jgi:hypothetical protein
MDCHPRFNVQVIFKVSFAASVPDPELKLAICGIVPTDAALNKAEARTDVNAPEAVNVCSIVVLFVPALWVFVVASICANPFVLIDDSVDAIKLAPRVPAATFV